MIVSLQNQVVSKRRLIPNKGIDMSQMDRASRVAFAALVHDIGKFAQRADIENSRQKKDIHVQLYCPRNAEGVSTHIHAAYTALGFDAMEHWTPELIKGDVSPFENVDDLSETDSLNNVTGRHHHPSTLLQRIVFAADRAASGFEREALSAEEVEDKPGGLNHVITRQWSLFEEIRLDAPVGGAPKLRKPLQALSVRALFPQLGIESTNRKEALKQYQDLWQAFLRAGEEIPKSIRTDLPLWLDAFDTLWLTYTQAIPLATAFGARPDVSLYDHSKTTAAIATALWQWCEASGRHGADLLEGFESRSLWAEQTLLFVQGDFFGIQDFIFSGAARTQKKAAKILRGRSFYVSLLTEAAALRVLEELNLPPTSQIINAAGKFLIVAPNTQQVRDKIQLLREMFDAWFVDQTCAQAGLGVAVQAGCLNDLVGKRFPLLQKSIFESLERAKLTRFDLFGKKDACGRSPVLAADYSLGPCAWQGCWPADRVDAEGYATCRITRDEIAVGEALVQADVLALLDAETPVSALPAQARVLEGDVFGYRPVFMTRREVLTWLKAESFCGVRRLWDFSMPESAEEVLWHGLSRRAINGYVPRAIDEFEFEGDARFSGLDFGEIGRERILPFEWLARFSQSTTEQGDVCGVAALCALKGDVDQLGRIFQSGLTSQKEGKEQRSMNFAKMAALSREVNAFFSTVVPYLCVSEFPRIYTVFAGGDDFSFIGPLDQTQKFATRLCSEFANYVGHNPEVHFSAGFAVVKPGMPIRRMSDTAENALEQAKNAGRNSVGIYGHAISWQQWHRLCEIGQELEQIRRVYGFSTSYLYALFDILELAGRSHEDPRAAIWRSRLYYRTTRWMQEAVNSRRLSKEAVGAETTRILTLLVQWLETHRDLLRIPLTNLFYQIRNVR